MAYQSRASRVVANFPITYLSESHGEAAIKGNCLNISDSGLLGEFAQALEIWTCGEILLHFGGGTLGIKVRVARANGKEAGIVFLFENAGHQQTIAETVAAATLEMERKGHVADVPF